MFRPSLKTVFQLLACFFSLTVSLTAMAGDFWQSLYGQSPSNSVDVGSLVFHFTDPGEYEGRYVYPMVGVTYHSIHSSVFKNTFGRATLGITMERLWMDKPLRHDFSFNVNYRAGMLFGGYCIESLDCHKHSLPIIPVAQVIGSVAYKNKVALNLTWLFAVFTASLQYRF